MKRYGFLSIALAAAVTVGCQNGRNDTNATNPPAGGSAVGTAGAEDHNITNGDKNFVKDIASGGTAEVELSRLATDKAVNPDVKKFAQMMVDDHTKANDELSALASQHNIPAPAQLDDKHRDLRDKLAKLSGADFDREYMNAMVDDHNDTIDKLGSRVDKSKLQESTDKTRDQATGKTVEGKVEANTVVPEKSDNAVTMSLNEWAARTYPTVKAHLEQAKTLQDTVKKRMTN